LTITTPRAHVQQFEWVKRLLIAVLGAAKTLENKLGKARSAAVAAIRICFFMRVVMV
jgi:hypothetical protein